MELDNIALLGEKIRRNMEKVIVGKQAELDLLLTAVICGGHVLLDDVPGTGKTTMAKALAKSVGCEFARIQFTPDLLPSDITGLSVYNQKLGQFEFRQGPAFTNILLADEINRATPRTQSALLECMEEQQITVDGVTRPLLAPFFVIATQNPVETTGTFNLPEAQLDRFLLRLRPGYPDAHAELDIIDRFINDSPLEQLQPVVSAQELVYAASVFSSVRASLQIRQYIVALTDATRTHPEAVLGVSPRGMLRLLQASQAYAALTGRDYVIPDDIKHLAVPVFAHRIMARSAYAAPNKAADIVRELLNTVPVPAEDPTAPLL